MTGVTASANKERLTRVIAKLVGKIEGDMGWVEGS